MARAVLAAAVALGPAAGFVACGGHDPKPAVAPVVVVIDAAPPADVAEAGPDAAAEIAEVAAPPLPSGDYEVTTEVLRDTCTAPDGGAPLAPATVTMFVPMKIWRDKSGAERVTGNFPLPLPKKGGFGGARSDIVLAPPPEPKSSAFSIQGLGSQCPTYETRTQHHVIERTSDRVRISYLRDYGDGSTCNRKVPSKCSLQYVYTFRLVRKLCDPHCGVSFVRSADAGPGPKCHCDDAGAP
ncbi:MAG: hypothetical protein KIT84_32765 [Labilithrix sp.]|nr:hypothetical protein [Labilithrix sp.]MCW5815848.1 hypothetical protein [Labilithrix sp.]